MNQIEYCYCLGGNTFFVSEVARILDEEMQPIFDELNWKESDEKFKRINYLNVRREPTMDAFSNILLVLGTFIITKFSDKAFDFIYGAKIKKGFEGMMKKILDEVSPQNNKDIIYQNLVYLSDIDVSILVRTIVNSKSDFEASFGDIKNVSLAAYEWVSANGKKANIHCYTIKDGRYSLVPSLFSSLEEAMGKKN